MDSELSAQSEGNILIVKGRFKSTSMNLYGLFLLSFNAMKKLDSHHVIVSSYSDMYEFDPNTPWHKFEEYIVDRKWKGNFNNSMTCLELVGVTARHEMPPADALSTLHRHLVASAARPPCCFGVPTR